jgi:aromatic ring-opening dioxygenase catalytic subunit (LigB family)
MKRRDLLKGLVLSSGALGVAALGCQTGTKRAAKKAHPPSPSEHPDTMSTLASTNRLPTLYIPHGGGPCFFMEWTMGPRDTWDRMAAYLRGIDASLPTRPRALLVISAHWEQSVPTVTTSAMPPMIFDYHGFPQHTYELRWPAPGSPQLAGRVRELLSTAGIHSGEDPIRGYDHGVFIPLLLAYPEARVPTVQLSLSADLDPARHLAMGRALAPLRDEGVLIVGSGMSYHNMQGFNRHLSRERSLKFDDWLGRTVAEPRPARDANLTRWAEAPEARQCHPREEHLIPLMVAAGAAGDDPGQRIFKDTVMGVEVSAIQFG